MTGVIKGCYICTYYMRPFLGSHIYEKSGNGNGGIIDYHIYAAGHIPQLLDIINIADIAAGKDIFCISYGLALTLYLLKSFHITVTGKYYFFISGPGCLQGKTSSYTSGCSGYKY